jgi:hypothetical protein
MSTYVNLCEMKFGRLTVIRRVANDKNRKAVFECECECGERVNVLSKNLKNGHSKSCGCLQRDVASIYAFGRGQA